MHHARHGFMDYKMTASHFIIHDGFKRHARAGVDAINYATVESKTFSL